jgi:hypothetical protein
MPGEQRQLRPSKSAAHPPFPQQELSDSDAGYYHGQESRTMLVINSHSVRFQSGYY